MTELLGIFDSTLLSAVPRFVTPILLAALGGLICARAGVFNIALEGLILAGAFGGVAGSFFFGGASLGVLTAILAGMAVAALFAITAIGFRGNAIVVAIAINLLVSGLTAFLLRALFGVRGAFQDPRLQGLAGIDLTGIEGVPVVGPMVSGQTWIVFMVLPLVGAVHVLLFRHRLGLRLRGVGENPEAARSLGVGSGRLQATALLMCGALCGLAGAQLSLGNVRLFVEDMSGGRGWMAVVAVMAGREHPLGVLGASVLFGFCDALGFRLQGLKIPSEFTGMLPYVATLAGLMIFQSRRQRARKKRVAVGQASIRKTATPVTH